MRADLKVRNKLLDNMLVRRKALTQDVSHQRNQTWSLEPTSIRMSDGRSSWTAVLLRIRVWFLLIAERLETLVAREMVFPSPLTEWARLCEDIVDTGRWLGGVWSSWPRPTYRSQYLTPGGGPRIPPSQLKVPLSVDVLSCSIDFCIAGTLGSARTVSTQLICTASSQ
jgi:hypothetical protein